MKRLLASLAALSISAMAVVPAQAATVLMLNNATGQANAGALDGPDGNVRLFSFIDGGNSVDVKATGWSINSGTVTDGFLGLFSGGLGVTNQNEGTGASPLHAVDNSGSIDFVLFQFSRAVTLNQVNLTSISGGDTDIRIGYGTLANWSVIPAIDNTPSASLGGLFTGQFDSNGTTAGGQRNVNPSAFSGNLWMISTANIPDATVDQFKLKSLTFTVPAVPEPETWMLMLVGFGAIGFGMRRRKDRISLRSDPT